MNHSENKIDEWANQRKKQMDGLTAEKLYPKILKGDLAALSMAITLVESENPIHKKEADALIAHCLPHTGSSWRIGITGVPGVGKSTFIESFGKLMIDKGHSLAVLAIDPSSEISGGSILGDKTRMNALSMMDKVYIRPSATRLNLGGVAQHTRESILLCEAAGFDVIIVETVGVGQSETVVHSMVDFFLLLMLAGAGDELQGIKRGIMEMADGILINKADGANLQAAKIAKKEFENALHLFQVKESEWSPKVSCVSSIEQFNIETPYTWLSSYFEKVKTKSYLNKLRNRQNVTFFEETIAHKISEYINQNVKVKEQYETLKSQIELGEISPFSGAQNIYELIFPNERI